jgi:hypothetical protein
MLGGSPLRGAFWLVDLILITAFSAVLVAPLFSLEFSNYWGTLDGPQIADIDFLNRHWPEPRWNPGVFGGVRADELTPPAARYLPVLLMRLTGFSAPRAYHFYLGLAFCLGIAGTYGLVRVATGDRLHAWFGAAWVALLAPSLALLPSVRADSWVGVPPRVLVLIKYGDGPHIAGLAFLTWSLAFAFGGLRTGSRPGLVLATLFNSLAIAHGTTPALASVFLLILLGWIITREVGHWRPLIRALASLALSFLVLAYWMTDRWWQAAWWTFPQTIRSGDTWSLWLSLALIGALVFSIDARQIKNAWSTFLVASSTTIAVLVVTRYWLGRTIFGNPLRFIPELDLVLVLLVLAGIWRLPRRVAVVASCGLLLLSAGFVANAWSENLYTRAEWIHRHEEDQQYFVRTNFPKMRVMASGSTGLWWNYNADVQQLYGGTEHRTPNSSFPAAMYQILNGDSAEWAILWMQALGTDAVIVPKANSHDVFRPYKHPDKFSGLPKLFDDGRGNVMYRVPRRYPALARVVETAGMQSLRSIAERPEQIERLQAYVDAVERGPASEPSTEWLNPELLRVRAHTDPGQSVLVQINWDPVWRAYENDRQQKLSMDAAGFILVEVPPGDHELYLVYRTRRKPLITAAISLLTFSGLILFAMRGRR